MQWLIEKLGPADAARLQQLTDYFHETHADQAWLAAWLAHPHHHLWAAFDGSQPAGFVSCYVLERIEHGRPELFLYEIEVAAQYHRQGLGRALVAAALRHARDQHMLNMFVLTNHDNPAAMALYEATGAQALKGDEIMYDWTLDANAGDSAAH